MNAFAMRLLAAGYTTVARGLGMGPVHWLGYRIPFSPLASRPFH